MEEGIKSMQIHTPQLRLLPELMHRIQSLLPPAEAVRTCVLSKSWLHGFSTMPTLRFTESYGGNKLKEKRYMESIDHTLLRYITDNIAMERIDLRIDTKHPRILHPAVKWLQLLASKSSLQELSLRICRDMHEYPFTIPDEIFCCENLNTLSLRVRAVVKMNENPMIKCSSLRVLELLHVDISEVALNNLFSTCKLLEKVDISCWRRDLQTIKVKNLLYLQELKIQLCGEDSSLEIYDVPSIRLFFFRTRWLLEPFKRDALRSVRELTLGGVIMDKAFSNMINSEIPFLEVLILKMTDCKLKTLDITCASLKRLSLSLRKKVQINIRVYESKLLYFCYNGCKMPSLLFPATIPAHIKLGLILDHLDDLSFFHNIRDMLNLSSTFHIKINDETPPDFMPLNIDLDELRRNAVFPARNVQQLSFKTRTTFSDAHFPKHSSILQALFLIFYPNYLRAYSPTSSEKVKNIMYILIVKGKLDKSILDLKDVQIKNPQNGQWETLTTNYSNSWRSSQESTDYLELSDEFKLNWCS